MKPFRDLPLQRKMLVMTLLICGAVLASNVFSDRPQLSSSATLERIGGVWSQGEAEDNHFWFPCYDYPNDMSTSEMVVTVNDRFTAISNGRLVAIEGEDFHIDGEPTLKGRTWRGHRVEGLLPNARLVPSARGRTAHLPRPRLLLLMYASFHGRLGIPQFSRPTRPLGPT